MKPLTKAITPLLAGLLALSLAACGDDEPTVAAEAPATSAAAPATESSTTAAEGQLSDDEILELTRGVAENMGESDPEQVEWVRASDRNGPAQLIRGEGAVVATPEGNVPVVVVSARGQFQQPPRQLPPGVTEEPPVRPALYLTIDESTREILDVDVTENLIDLDELGEVHSG